ncbi:hypothetical protein Tco_0517261, partial [Tanacetum coccineum]
CPDLYPLDLDLSLLAFSLVMLLSSSLLNLLKYVPEDSRENRLEKPLASDLARASLPEKGNGFSALVASQPCLLRFSSLGRLGCWIPQMTPNVEVNLRGLLRLDKVTLAVMNIKISLVPLKLNHSSPS